MVTDLKATLEGKNINLLVYDGPDKGRYFSAVYKIENSIVTIIAPNKDGTLLLLPVGTKVAISFWDDIRAYMFETKIIGRSNSYIPTFSVEMPKKFIEIQRRNFVRVLTINPISFQQVSIDNDVPAYWLKAYSLDLSGGGIRFTTSEKMKKEDAINISFSLPDKDIQTLARVCRVEKDNETGQFTVAAEFISLSKQDREKIISHIFNVQRNLLKKGLI